MANFDHSDFKINVNGEELTGENAKEFAEKISKNLAESLNGLVTNKLGNFTTNTMTGNFTDSLNPLKNLNGLFNQTSLGNNGVQNIIPALSKMIPVFETSDDNQKIKLSLNGVSLLDLDLSDLPNKNSSNRQ
ncbi:hypothetical protein J2Z40_000766 [Cytobacillus eiseniae]|uniref:Uncharacterized protein n=1 Tax=Cytobacillus eiseniae TaxID=762947 RepID=A0ABS4RBE4_9BACI|nr:hypothetical protein [Cytobacillus eiseniae]MBP2240213.1 hypothetical protein [Cytobacillus eiseniae]